MIPNSIAMLAGLLFAIQDAEDGASALAATLPFGGVTLLEYQARLLQQAGASQVVVVVGRLTPELLGAVARIGRRGCTVDAVRTAGEAVAKMHPLARILMIADGLVTGESAVARLADGDGDALLVLEPGLSAPGLERVGEGLSWAGIARLIPDRLAEVAAMPRDYDVQSTLLRSLAQAGAARVPLRPAESAGHGVQRNAGALEALNRVMMDRSLTARSGWFDRWIVAPLARPALSLMLGRGIGTVPLAAGVAAAGLGGLLALWSGQPVLGLTAALVAVIGASAGRVLAEMRDEPVLDAGLEAMILGVPILAFLVLGHGVDQATAGDAGLVTAVALSVAVALAEQATRDEAPPLWHGGTGGALVLVALGALAQAPSVALMIAGGYAAVTLAAMIERRRGGI
ncbi:hypothetical protein [Sphingomonas sp.]|uniref:hypothetical protein n=1 Tax=Sphingomonas sp. TaxID=28214 RepID=UPI0035C825C0